VAAPKAETRRAVEPVPSAPATGAADKAGDLGEVVHVRTQDGLLLAVRVFAAPASSRLPLLCLPGLSRNSRDFLALGAFFAKHPAEPRRVVAVDFRGRGLSDPDPDYRRYTPLVEAHDVVTAAAALGIERAIVVGTSRGGIVAMVLGALRPGLLAGVVLNDIGPVIEGTGLARIKKQLSATRRYASMDDAVAALRAAAEQHFPAVGEEDWLAFASAFLVDTEHGLQPQFDARLLKADQSLDLAERVPTLWPQFTGLGRVPALAIRGEHSDILSARTLAAMAERHPQFEQLTVRGQGHPPLLRDLATLERIRSFAKRCEHPAVR
jgi:pimeloyl-ACP methyl ester carboxylesterase